MLLLTAGATREYLDDVRFLTNVSTGGTGARLADALQARGHLVHLLHGEGAQLPDTLPADQRETFSSTRDLQARLRRHLASGRYHTVIQAAAVSDYAPATQHSGKLGSYADELTVRFVPTPKLLPELKHYAPPGRPLRVIGFKLTSRADAAARHAAVARLFTAGTVDAVIHNDLQDLAAGDARPFQAWTSLSQATAAPAPLAGLAALVDWLHAYLSQPADGQIADPCAAPLSAPAASAQATARAQASAQSNAQ